MVIGGVYRRVQLAHMKLCASRAFWLCAYPGQSHEMLFDAHPRALTGLGGVARRGIYDNMKTAVDKVALHHLQVAASAGAADARVQATTLHDNNTYQTTLQSQCVTQQNRRVSPAQSLEPQRSDLAKTRKSGRKLRNLGVPEAWNHSTRCTHHMAAAR